MTSRYPIRPKPRRRRCSPAARRRSNPAEVASAAEVVVASLPTPDLVKAVAFGGESVLRCNRAATFVYLSTTGPRVAMQVAAEFARSGTGRATVDAPVSGAEPVRHVALAR